VPTPLLELRGTAAALAGIRCRLLESVAAYARGRLTEMEDLALVRDGHLGLDVAVAENAEPALRGGDQQSRLAWLDVEAGNTPAALQHALDRADSGSSDDAARLMAFLLPATHRN
jgi:hypothetical protein